MAHSFGVNEWAKLVWLLPEFVAKLGRGLAAFEERTGLKTVVVSGHRDESVQAKTYADSLNAKGVQVYRAAPPGKSKHPFAAADINIIGRTAGDAAKDAQSRDYATLAEEMEKVGLKSGLRFKGGLPDPYHVEDARPVAELAKLHATFLRGRLWRAAVAVIAIGAAIYFAARYFTLRGRR